MPTEPSGGIDERSRALIAGIEAIRPRYVLHLPSSMLKATIQHFLQAPAVRTFPIPREEEGVGILAGLALAGQPAVMIIQDNGIGNLLTATATFPADALAAALSRAAVQQGPVLLHVPVGTLAPPTQYFLEDPVVLGEDFRRWLEARPSSPVEAPAEHGSAGP